jgi:hypothetical protein
MLQELATTRLDDVRTLLASRRWAGAYYLAGYIVECALKACIAKKTQQYDFPDKNRANKSWEHDLVKLAGVAELGLQEALDRDPAFARLWNVVKDWSEQKRYETMDARSAHDLVDAISDPEHGVLQWLREHW